MYWYKIIAHEYMDEHPTVSFRLFQSNEDAYSYENNMNRSYSGGTTSVVPAVKAEVLDYIERNRIELDQTQLDDVNNEQNYRFTA